MHDIERLDALGRGKGLVIYAIHQANAGWGCQWYEPISQQFWDETLDENWRRRLVVYNYYPTVSEMIEAETKRVSDWEVVTDA